MSRFGTPHRVSHRPCQDSDPDPSDPPCVETTFEFNGVKIVADASHPADGSRELLRVHTVEVTTAAIELKYGLRVGQPLAKFIELFGESRDGALTAEMAGYDDVAYFACGENKDITCAVSFGLGLTLDQKQRVRKVATSTGGRL